MKARSKEQGSRSSLTTAKPELGPGPFLRRRQDRSATDHVTCGFANGVLASPVVCQAYYYCDMERDSSVVGCCVDMSSVPSYYPYACKYHTTCYDGADFGTLSGGGSLSSSETINSYYTLVCDGFSGSSYCASYWFSDIEKVMWGCATTSNLRAEAGLTYRADTITGTVLPVPATTAATPDTSASGQPTASSTSATSNVVLGIPTSISTSLTDTSTSETAVSATDGSTSYPTDPCNDVSCEPGASSDPTPTIVGSSIGAAAAVFILIALIYVFGRRKRKQCLGGEKAEYRSFKFLSSNIRPALLTKKRKSQVVGSVNISTNPEFTKAEHRQSRPEQCEPAQLDSNPAIQAQSSTRDIPVKTAKLPVQTVQSESMSPSTGSSDRFSASGVLSPTCHEAGRMHTPQSQTGLWPVPSYMPYRSDVTLPPGQQRSMLGIAEMAGKELTAVSDKSKQEHVAEEAEEGSSYPAGEAQKVRIEPSESLARMTYQAGPVEEWRWS